MAIFRPLEKSFFSRNVQKTENEIKREAKEGIHGIHILGTKINVVLET